jgi:hypothetical protein
MSKSATFITILRVKKCHFHYDMQKINIMANFSKMKKKTMFNDACIKTKNNNMYLLRKIKIPESNNII